MMMIVIIQKHRTRKKKILSFMITCVCGRVCKCVCVCMCVCEYVCIKEIEKERERKKWREQTRYKYVCLD